MLASGRWLALLLLGLVCSAEAVRFSSITGEASALIKKAHKAAEKAIVGKKTADAAGGDAPVPGGIPAYKNTKPIIGVLTQPCHDCPGK